MYGCLYAERGPEEIDLTYKVKMICMNFTRWRKLLVILTNSDFMPRMLDSDVKLGKSFLEKWPTGLWETCWILICRRLEFDVRALKRSLNTQALKRRGGRRVGGSDYFIVKVYLQSKCMSVLSTQLKAL